MLTGTYFFIKGEEPTENELKFYGFNSSKDELKTYLDSAMGIIVFFAILGGIFGGLLLLLNMVR
jgi:hypothetical protein